MQFSINNAKHVSTGYTPFFLNYGRHPRSPLSNEITALKAAAHVHTPGLPALSEVLQEMEVTLNRVKRSLQAAQDRQKSYADKHRRPHQITEGMHVLLSSKSLRFQGKGKRKLFPKFIGPFLVSEMVGQNAARLKLPGDWLMHPVFHVSLLKPFRGDPPDAVMVEDSIPLDLQHMPAYEVESILATRLGSKKQTEFLCKWSNFTDDHNSWETAENLPAQLVGDFWAASRMTRR